VSHRLLWLLLAGLIVAVVLLFANYGEGRIGSLSSADVMSLTYKVVLLAFLGGTLLVIFRRRFWQALAAAVLWIALALVLIVGYAFRFELRAVADRVIAELVPGHVSAVGRNVTIERASTGDFAVNARINGARLAMILDTGATSVVLTPDDAKAAGLPIEVLAYTVNIDTANGRARAAPVTLDRVAIGGLVERSVEALVAQPGQLRISLLGMSFLNRLQSWEVRGDQLLLRGYP
jgi:aspartyl protease family protein